MTDKKYQSGGPEYYYPAYGDQLPDDLNAKVQLLTIGGIHVTGAWSDGHYVAWYPLPKRNKLKEKELNFF